MVFAELPARMCVFRMHVCHLHPEGSLDKTDWSLGKFQNHRAQSCWRGGGEEKKDEEKDMVAG